MSDNGDPVGGPVDPDARYRAHKCTANNLTKMLNDLDKSGFEMTNLFHVGTEVLDNPLMPSQKTAIPIFIGIFIKKMVM